MQDWLVMQVFYGGLSTNTKTIVDAAAGVAFLSKDYAETYELLKEVTTNASDWSSRRDNEKKVAVNNNPYSKTYNPRWQNHPNFSWKNLGQAAPPYQQQQQQHPRMNLEEAMAKLLAS
ncbi:hypothetical protein L6164_026277 [Bauhinia variegata]|uniref:Uncharacterized protein n=1 Tax=Bauhinia variegata TaxID=167791 RepID=A0ACB9LPM0_BAUVA|nr:hypothetical protein L6164_026277 [Bauhinia variegata]